MTLKEFVHRFVIVHKCACCSEILEYERLNEAFCSECKLAWRSAMTESCGECFKEISECACMPKRLSSAGALTLRKLVFYSSEHRSEPQSRLIFKLKNNKNKRYSSFVAAQMRSAVMSELKNLVDINSADIYKRVVITYVPRSKKAKRENGVDQSEQICKALSNITGIPVKSVIKRKRSGKEQKNLTMTERFKNTESLFELYDDADISGKYVILFDDIVTTGASLTACTRILRKGRAKGVLCFCIARDKLKR